MLIAVGSDHAGFALKGSIIEHLLELGHEPVDLGTNSADSVDYPDYGAAVARTVVAGDAGLGIAVCGSGIGICMAAAKVPGARAATVHDVTSARMSRRHNDANVMCLGERFVGVQVALDAVDAFLTAEFEGGRHQRRVDKISALDAAPPTPSPAPEECS